MVPFLTSQKVSSWSLRGILNLEWAVRPPGRSRAAIAEEATSLTFLFDFLKAEMIVLYKNVFPVPPAPLIKESLPCFSKTDNMTSSYITLCSSLSLGNNS
ncbi:unnamed protein product [Brassica oleracea var. botrytis]